MKGTFGLASPWGLDDTRVYLVLRVLVLGRENWKRFSSVLGCFEPGMKDE